MFSFCNYFIPYFKPENQDNSEKFGLKINSDDSVEYMKTVARGSMVNSAKCSNVV
jgi:hypothetical protein